jgi:2-polyprenyl-3-methyl-5-hydroxy-6-metoxy-1,4-benzoquinol methylase
MKKERLTEDKSSERNKKATIPEIDFEVARGETQKYVNENILKFLVKRFDKTDTIKILDMPCGNMLFDGYLKLIFPHAQIVGADIQEPISQVSQFVKMDLTKDFILPIEEKYDLITSISGIMMFGNTLSFITNCVHRLKPEGTFIITNDNSATIADKLFFLFLGRYRLFKPIFEDEETLIQNVSIQELCRLLRINGLEIETIDYTSIYAKDLIFFPIAFLIYPIQMLYLYYKTKFSTPLVKLIFPFKQYFCRHYIIVTKKIS